jgi:hypothetical protein
MKTLELKMTMPVTYEVFENIIVTAIEGGSNYWYLLGDLDPVRAWCKENGIERGEPMSVKIAKALFNDPEFTLNVYDLENEDDVLGTITQASMLKAMALHPEEALKFINEEDFDAWTADTLFQTAVMGEVVFG